jgi:hypothetical protein
MLVSGVSSAPSSVKSQTLIANNSSLIIAQASDHYILPSWLVKGTSSSPSKYRIGISACCKVHSPCDENKISLLIQLLRFLVDWWQMYLEKIIREKFQWIK